MSQLAIIATLGGVSGASSITKLAGDGDSQFGGAGYGSAVILAANTLGVEYNNFTHSGYTSGQIKDLIATEILGLSTLPSHCCINPGVNDVNNGLSTSTVVNNYNTMLSDLSGAGIVPVVITIPGWNNGSNTQNAQIDDINAGIAALVFTYPTTIIVDDRALLCQFRTGGTAGNLWDLKPAYNADGVHLNSSGQSARAGVIVSALTL